MTPTMSTNASKRIFATLLELEGKQGWWPAATDFEMMIGAILVQHTAWANVEYSLNHLRDAGILSVQKIFEAQPQNLEALIRPTGFMKAKARTCHALSNWLLDHECESDNIPEDTSIPRLRESLLSVKGIGQETADVIRLYAFKEKCFIWDVYARRMLAALGYPSYSTYEAALKNQDVFISLDDYSLNQLGEYHGLIVEAGKRAGKEKNWEFLTSQIISQPDR